MAKQQLSARQKQAIVDLYREKKSMIEKQRREKALNSPQTKKLFSDFLKLQEKFKKAIDAFAPVYKEYFTFYLDKIIDSNSVNWGGPSLDCYTNKSCMGIELSKELTLEKLRDIYSPEYTRLPDESILSRDLEIKSISGEFDVDEFISSYLK